MAPRTLGTRAAQAAVIYVRVSTGDQTVENQKPELLQLADARAFKVVEVLRFDPSDIGGCGLGEIG